MRIKILLISIAWASTALANELPPELPFQAVSGGELVKWYETLDPSKRKQLTLFGSGAALFVAAAILITATSDDKSKSFIQKPRKVEYTLFNGKSPRDVSIDAMAGKIKKLTEDFSNIRMTFQRQDQKIQEASELIKTRSDELINALKN